MGAYVEEELPGGIVETSERALSEIGAMMFLYGRLGELAGVFGTPGFFLKGVVDLASGDFAQAAVDGLAAVASAGVLVGSVFMEQKAVTEHTRGPKVVLGYHKKV